MPWKPRRDHLPNGWRVHRGRDPEKELRQLKRRFRAVSRRHERAIMFRRLRRWAWLPALAVAAAAVYLGLNGLPAWPPAAIAPAAETPAYSCWWNVYDCRDFRTRADAQAAYESCGGPGNDVHRLDEDGDGLACEFLP